MVNDLTKKLTLIYHQLKLHNQLIIDCVIKLKKLQEINLSTEIDDNLSSLSKAALLFEEQLKNFVILIEKSKEVSIDDETYTTMRHELRTPVNGIKGYTEMSLETINEYNLSLLGSSFKVIESIAKQILDLIDGITSGQEQHKASQKPKLPAQKPAKEESKQVSKQNKNYILIITDLDTTSKNGLTSWLQQHDYKVALSDNIQDSLAMLDQEEIDLVLVDMKRPEKDGFEILRLIKQNVKTYDIPVILLSEIDKTEFVAQSILLGAEDYMTKPLNMVLVEARLKVSIDKKRQRAMVKAELDNLLKSRSSIEPIAPLTQSLISPHLQRIAMTNKTTKAKNLILVVDDIESNRDLLSSWITRKGYQVITTDNGIKALELLAKTKDIDVILLDVMMPEMDGYEVLTRIRQDPQLSDIPIIMISALDEIDTIAKCIEAGAEDYLLKPFNSALLSARIAAGLEKKQLRELEKKRIDNILEELNVAQRIQLSLLPRRFPSSKKWELFARSIPAKEVGGDFYDFYEPSENKLIICIGDVSGKGIPAALLMAVSRTILYTLNKDEQNLNSYMQRTNQILLRDNESMMFVTLFFGIFDASNGKLTYINAGHLYPIVIRAGGKIEVVTAQNDPALGVIAEAQYHPRELTLEDGDKLFVYTDGVTDAINDAYIEFSLDNLKAILEETVGTSPIETIEKVVSAVMAFGKVPELVDDITCLALTYNKEGASKKEIYLNADMSELLRLKNYIDQFCAENSLADDIHYNIQLACEELFVNAIVHGKTPAITGSVIIRFHIKDNKLTILFQDKGDAFNPLEIEKPDMQENISLRELGGLGVYLFRHWADEITYERHERTNCIKLIKNL